MDASEMKKKENPFAVYAKVSQIAFVILGPLLFFIVGGYYVVKYFGLPQWVMGICVALGILFMIGGAVSYLSQLIKTYEKSEKRAPKAFTSSPKDNDYYDDHKNR